MSINHSLRTNCHSSGVYPTTAPENFEPRIPEKLWLEGTNFTREASGRAQCEWWAMEDIAGPTLDPQTGLAHPGPRPYEGPADSLTPTLFSAELSSADKSCPTRKSCTTTVQGWPLANGNLASGAKGWPLCRKVRQLYSAVGTPEMPPITSDQTEAGPGLRPHSCSPAFPSLNPFHSVRSWSLTPCLRLFLQNAPLDSAG